MSMFVAEMHPIQHFSRIVSFWRSLFRIMVPIPILTPILDSFQTYPWATQKQSDNKAEIVATYFVEELPVAKKDDMGKNLN